MNWGGNTLTRVKRQRQIRMPKYWLNKVKDNFQAEETHRMVGQGVFFWRSQIIIRRWLNEQRLEAKEVSQLHHLNVQ